eukprot:5550549-Amphidinium_carterae.1
MLMQLVCAGWTVTTPLQDSHCCTSVDQCHGLSDTQQPSPGPTVEHFMSVHRVLAFLARNFTRLRADVIKNYNASSLIPCILKHPCEVQPPATDHGVFSLKLKLKVQSSKKRGASDKRACLDVSLHGFLFGHS